MGRKRKYPITTAPVNNDIIVEENTSKSESVALSNNNNNNINQIRVPGKRGRKPKHLSTINNNVQNVASSAESDVNNDTKTADDMIIVQTSETTSTTTQVQTQTQTQTQTQKKRGRKRKVDSIHHHNHNNNNNNNNTTSSDSNCNAPVVVTSSKKKYVKQQSSVATIINPVEWSLAVCVSSLLGLHQISTALPNLEWEFRLGQYDPVIKRFVSGVSRDYFTSLLFLIQTNSTWTLCDENRTQDNKEEEGGEEEEKERESDEKEKEKEPGMRKEEKWVETIDVMYKNKIRKTWRVLQQEEGEQVDQPNVETIKKVRIGHMDFIHTSMMVTSPTFSTPGYYDLRFSLHKEEPMSNTGDEMMNQTEQHIVKCVRKKRRLSFRCGNIKLDFTIVWQGKTIEDIAIPNAEYAQFEIEGEYINDNNQNVQNYDEQTKAQVAQMFLTAVNLLGPYHNHTQLFPVSLFQFQS